MPKYTVNVSDHEITVDKVPPPPKGFDKFQNDLAKVTGKLLEIAFWIAGGIAIGDIFGG